MASILSILLRAARRRLRGSLDDTRQGRTGKTTAIHARRSHVSCRYKESIESTPRPLTNIDAAGAAQLADAVLPVLLHLHIGEQAARALRENTATALSPHAAV
jgi:hypothetical protein